MRLKKPQLSLISAFFWSEHLKIKDFLKKSIRSPLKLYFDNFMQEIRKALLVDFSLYLKSLILGPF